MLLEYNTSKHIESNGACPNLSFCHICTDSNRKKAPYASVREVTFISPHNGIVCVLFFVSVFCHLWCAHTCCPNVVNSLWYMHAFPHLCWCSVDRCVFWCHKTLPALLITKKHGFPGCQLQKEKPGVSMGSCRGLDTDIGAVLCRWMLPLGIASRSLLCVCMAE